MKFFFWRSWFKFRGSYMEFMRRERKQKKLLLMSNHRCVWCAHRPIIEGAPRPFKRCHKRRCWWPVTRETPLSKCGAWAFHSMVCIYQYVFLITFIIWSNKTIPLSKLCIENKINVKGQKIIVGELCWFCF
jgi:hypothetical protein